MAITQPIRQPLSGGEAFSQGLTESQNIINSFIRNRALNAKANLPFGGEHVPGVAGEVVGLEMIKMLYGENSPQYKQAQSAFNLSQQSIGSRNNYQNALTNTIGLRYTSPGGRQIIEQSNVNQGASPAGTPIGQPVTPGSPPYNPGAPVSETGKHYNLRQTKEDVPATVLSKNLYATNIEKTIDNIDLDVLTNYNTPLGQFKLKQQQALDAAGKSNETYKKYVAEKEKLRFLADQIRQFYGSSVQPSEVQERMNRIDPTGVFSSKETGREKFKSNAALLKKELETYRQAAKNTDVYHGKGINSNDEVLNSVNKSENHKSTKVLQPGKITIIDSNGDEHVINEENLEKARERDIGLRVKE
jgi:hypothetical protein